MAYGCRIWKSGSLIFDSNTFNSGRRLGTLDTGTSSGSVTDAGFTEGTPWWQVFSKGTGNGLMQKPNVAMVDSDTLGWTQQPGNETDCRIVYGFC